MKYYIIVIFYLLTLSSGFASELERIIDIHITEYESAYPDMDIVRIYHQPNMSISNIKSLLGEDADNIDYEHPEDVKDLLVEAQLDRIDTLSRAGMPSSTLFRRKNSLQPYICVITLDPKVYEAGVYSATKFMFDLDDNQYKWIKKKYILSNHKFVQFLLDHEIFHCIYSRKNGFTYPKTKNQTKSYYDQYHVESLADLYAIMTHRHRYPADEDFITSIRHAKVLNLLNWDITHYTSAMFSAQAFLANKQIPLRVDDVVNRGINLVPDYENFKQDMLSAFYIIKTNHDSTFTLPYGLIELESVLLDLTYHQSMATEINDTLKDLFAYKHDISN